MSYILSLIYSYYFPVKSIVIYFVISKFFFSSQSKIQSIEKLILSSIYHAFLLYILILYMRILANEDSVNVSQFSRKPVYYKIKHIEDLNPFIKEELYIKKKKMNKFCHYCDTYKPPRSQHCNKCNKCYLKNHKHSKLFGCCICFQNYKFYLIFIIANFFLNIFIFVILSIINPYLIFAVIFELLYFVISIPFEISLVFNNETLYEYNAINDYMRGNIMSSDVFQEGFISNRMQSKDRAVLNPYNISSKDNLRQVFGSSFLGWINCDFTTEGDGLHFTKNYKSENIFD